MNYSVIVVGDELLIGQVVDTNSGYIARHLSPYGWQATQVLVVPDEAQAISDAVAQSMAATPVVLMTGGLGPTKDDITKEVLCKYFGGKLVYDESVAQNVETVVAKRHLKNNDYTRAQAMVPSSCRVIQNEVGTAPLMWFERDGRVLVSMPGVPHEMQTMLTRAVIPQLLKQFMGHDAVEYRTLIVTGITESQLAMDIDAWERALPAGIHLAYLPQPGVLRLRLTGVSSDAASLHATMDELQAQLQDLVGDHLICNEDKPLAAILGDALRERHLTVSTAESCTGGNIAHELTRIAGSSDYYMGSVISYSNDIKIKQLGVSASDIEAHGVVSEPVVEQMTAGVCRLLGTDCAMATSGIAGPGGATPGKPVGTVWIAARCGDRVVTRLLQLPGDRDRVINRATTEAMLLLLGVLRAS